MRTTTAILFLAVAIPAACQTLHVSIVSHNEEPANPRQPNYLTNPVFYQANRDLVRQLALGIRQRGAKWNLQSDWNFLQAVARYDTPAVTASTNGKNILRWLVEDLGFEADPHAHETRYNYADVAYLHQQLGLTPSKVVGGFIYSPADNPQGWDQHQAGIHGRVYGSYFWRADLLWGGGTAGHVGQEEESYGAWRPRSEADFATHDPAQRLIYLGQGCRNLIGTGETPGIDAFLAAATKGRLFAGLFYSTTIMLNQGQLTRGQISDLFALLDRLAPYVQTGQVRFTGLTEGMRLWQTEYGGRPNRVTCEAMERLGL